ncbi:MAG: hypothetical protein JWL89_711 [Candidatus Saccharibacteria bacterium]|nr:hypothetical protein [Candidatus Saccharibacteria bacterium]
MPHKNAPAETPTNIHNQVLAGGVAAMLGAAGLAGGVAPAAATEHLPISPEHTMPAPHATKLTFEQFLSKQPASLQDQFRGMTPEKTAQTLQGAETAHIPESIEKIMRHDTAYLTSLRCSGSVIKSEQGAVLGATTAEHCGLTNTKNERIEGSDGKFYIVQPQRVKVRIGADHDRLKTVATIDKYIVPQTGDFTNDTAIAVDENHTPEEALAAYTKSVATPEDLRQLKFGDTIYNASWPVHQPKNLNGRMERQAFSAKFVGLGKSRSDEGKSMDVVYAGFPQTTDGSSSTPGASGSVSFFMKHGKALKVGPMSTFIDLTGGFSGKQPNGTAPNPLATPDRGASEIAGVSYAIPKLEGPERNSIVLHSVHSAKEIPGYVDPIQIINKASETIQNPDMPKSFIEGSAAFTDPNERNSLKGGQLVVNKPIILHDAEHRMTVLAWAKDDGPDESLSSHLEFAAFKDSELYKVSIYSADSAATSITTLPVIGSLQYEAGDKSGDDSLLDEQQQKFGHRNFAGLGQTGTAFKVSVGSDGQLQFDPYKGMK